MIELNLNYTNEFDKTLIFQYDEAFDANTGVTLQYTDSFLLDTGVFNSGIFFSLKPSKPLRQDYSYTQVIYNDLKPTEVLDGLFFAPLKHLNSYDEDTHKSLIRQNVDNRYYSKISAYLSNKINYASLHNSTPYFHRQNSYKSLGKLFIKTKKLYINYKAAKLDNSYTLSIRKNRNDLSNLYDKAYIKLKIPSRNITLFNYAFIKKEFNIEILENYFLKKNYRNFIANSWIWTNNQHKNKLRSSKLAFIEKKELFKNTHINEYFTSLIPKRNLLSIDKYFTSLSNANMLAAINTFNTINKNHEDFKINTVTFALPSVAEIKIYNTIKSMRYVYNKLNLLEHLNLYKNKANGSFKTNTFLYKDHFNLMYDNGTSLWKEKSKAYYTNGYLLRAYKRTIFYDKFILQCKTYENKIVTGKNSELKVNSPNIYYFNGNFVNKIEKQSKSGSMNFAAIFLNKNFSNDVFINIDKTLFLEYKQMSYKKENFQWLAKKYEKLKTLSYNFTYKFDEDLNYEATTFFSIKNLDIMKDSALDIYRQLLSEKYPQIDILYKPVLLSKAIKTMLPNKYTRLNIEHTDIFSSKKLIALNSKVNNTYILKKFLYISSKEKVLMDKTINSNFRLKKEKLHGKEVLDHTNFNIKTLYIAPLKPNKFISSKALELGKNFDYVKYFNFASMKNNIINLKPIDSFAAKRTNRIALLRAIFISDIVNNVTLNTPLIAIDSINANIKISDFMTSLNAIVINANYENKDAWVSDIVKTSSIDNKRIFVKVFDNMDIFKDEVLVDSIVKSSKYKNTPIFIADSIKYADLNKQKILSNMKNEVFLANDKITFNTKLLLDIYNEQISSVKIMNSSSFFREFNTLKKSKSQSLLNNNVYIINKAMLDNFISSNKKLNLNKKARRILLGKNIKAKTNEIMPQLDLTAGGIDELLLPQTDFNYAVFKDDLLDPITKKPINPVKEIDDKTFIAKRPTNHPIPEFFDIGREYIEVNVNLLRELIDTFYKLWKANMFEFGAIDMRQAVTKMLDYLNEYINYNIPEPLLPAAKRVLRLIRWYGEVSILKNAQYKIHIIYAPLKSDLNKGSCNIPNTMNNMFVNSIMYSIQNTDTTSDAWIEFTLDNPVSTTFTFNLYMTSGTLEIYLNDKLINTIETSEAVEFPLDVGNNTVKLMFNNKNNGSINLANICVKDYIYSDIVTEYEPYMGSGNKVLDELTKRVAVYADVYSKNANFVQATINGNLAVAELVNKLSEYFALHHEKKNKGKRLTIKKS
ncbi:hypothetical protein [Clostridium felsineum]|uniref:Uncharacterized protein n=1 Tax=Clostridium felsineum TaxID=36839 RepID=A0A1S8L2B8_9CLOT|nr:hypothetical protein [Clostridium felsineum]URZ09242.1 hypothetical protein CLROS_046580 [Clostridium felsineum]URZ13928.1 hypothetical protein CROST_047060 [Clostridium felsineum]